MTRSTTHGNTSEDFIRGTLVAVLYHDEATHYSVFKLFVEEAKPVIDQNRIVVVGSLVRPEREQVYICYGMLTEHPRYGVRYHANKILRSLPQTQQAVIEYLCSPRFPGIGLRTASRIVEELGNQALELILQDPKVLEKIPSLPRIRAEQLVTVLEKEHSQQNILLFLHGLGLSSLFVAKIFEKYGEEAENLIRNNPYRLIEDVEGIGFVKADDIASQCGIPPHSPFRFEAAVLWSLKRKSQEQGHVFLPEEDLLVSVQQILGSSSFRQYFPPDVRFSLLSGLWSQRRVIVEGKRYHLPHLYRASLELATRIQVMLTREPSEDLPPKELWNSLLEEAEGESGISYAPAQRESLRMACVEPLSLLLGGPGTGKTTVLRSVCHLLTTILPKHTGSKDVRILLAAPTGRAAKRLQESTGMKTTTIHSLLGWRGGQTFQYSAEKPLEGDFLIVDEVSMLDISLAYRLFVSIPEGMRVLLVGDSHQLPPVGPGNVLQQLIQIATIPRVTLETIFRQQEGSSIVQLAADMQKGKLNLNALTGQSDCYFFPCSGNQVAELVVRVVTRAIRKGHTLHDVQVLAPMYKGIAGIDHLNRDLQAALNPKDADKGEITVSEGLVLRRKDKVLQLVNHNKHPVCNGEMGFVSYVDEEAVRDEPVVQITFEDGLQVPYLRNELNQLTLAYACSVHKAQGSEFSVVILPVLAFHGCMLQRNLLYTGITRSKNTLVICGELSAFRTGINRQENVIRYDRLAQQIIASMW
ncbi:SF1B family DNA helicase RecD2 [Pasteuria penetrans]|uniref:SF1B family DNA helicase RecD2 n=1 Tax=Pasteuria penetrans TaxID=86005 RepID=UPI000FB075E1|nr:ATP-dependent RecD-like DNA helicase [Pasteuria penetrans]